MNSSTYIIFLIIFILVISSRNNKMNLIIKKKIFKKRTQGEITEMVNLAKNFVGKECIISTILNRGFVGILKEVSDSAILIENGGNVEAVSLEFVLSIKEYPRKKNGKKKAIVL